MEFIEFLPLIEKFGSWAGPVASTISGAFAGSWFSQRYMDKQASRDLSEKRKSLLEIKAEEILNSANSAIACNDVSLLERVDAMVRLHFDTAVVVAFEDLIESIKSYGDAMLVMSSVEARLKMTKNTLAAELGRSIRI